MGTHGFVRKNDSFYNEDRDIEVWSYVEDGNTIWAYTSSALGAKIENEGFPYPELAVMSSLVLVPTEEESRQLARETFDSMSDSDRLALVQELNFEHGNLFEWSEIIPVHDFFDGLDINEVVRVAIYGNLSNEIDPVRYDKYGDAEQVSYDEVYSEICENEDEILDCLVEVLESGLSIYCTSYFDQLGYAISDGKWRELLEDDELREGQEVRVCGKG